jgi:regulatory protein
VSVESAQTPVRDGDDRLQHALELAHAYLNRRERTVAELRRQLERRGIAEQSAEAAITVLTEQGYLNDTRFAELFVSDKRELEQWGNERIRRGLVARGIEPRLAERTLETGVDGGGQETELERALALLRRRFPVAPRDQRERQRALGVLLRKGYETELALDALAAHARGS